MSYLITTVISTILPVYAIAAVIYLSVVALSYMGAKITGNQEWVNWVKVSLGEIIFMIIFPLLLIMFDAVADQIVYYIDEDGANLYCHGASPCFLIVGGSYLEMLLKDLISAYESFIKISFFTRTLVNTGFELNGPVPALTLGYSPFAMYTPTQMFLDYLMDYFRTAIITITFQYFFLVSFVQFFPHLLALGLVLRMIPFTKKLGGLILAITLVFYYFYPLMLSFYDQFYNAIPFNSHTNGHINRFSIAGLAVKVYGVNGPEDYDISNVVTDVGNESQQVQDIKQQINDTVENFSIHINIANPELTQGEYSGVKKVLNWIVTKILSILKKSAFSLAFLVGPPLLMLSAPISTPAISFFASLFGLGTAVAPMFFGPPLLTVLMDIASDGIIFGSILPLIALIATIASIKSLSNALGGDVEIAGLTHLI